MSNNTKNDATLLIVYSRENEMPSHYYNVRADTEVKPAPL